MGKEAARDPAAAACMAIDAICASGSEDHKQ